MNIEAIEQQIEQKRHYKIDFQPFNTVIVTVEIRNMRAVETASADHLIKSYQRG